MTGTVRPGTAEPVRLHEELVGAAAIRPWSALICGTPDDRTLLVVDWLVLACRTAGYVASALPIDRGGGQLHAMYLEVASEPAHEHLLADTPWGAVDLLVAGEHLELVRALGAGFSRADVTTIVSSCRRSYTSEERFSAPQHVLAEREIDAVAARSCRAYHAFDGVEVAGWYRLPAAAEPALLFGALCGTGVTGLDESTCRSAIAELGIDVQLHEAAFGRGLRLGRRPGGRVRRVVTAGQFTRKRRAAIEHRSRRAFDELVERAPELVAPSHVPALQEAIFRLCEYQDAAYAGDLVDHVAEVARLERRTSCDAPTVQSVVPDVIRSLASIMVAPDSSWAANRKLRSARLKELRAQLGASRNDTYELVDHLPIPSPGEPALLAGQQVERVRTTSLRGALRLRRLAGRAGRRPASRARTNDLATVDAYIEVVCEALERAPDVANIVARSGTLVEGAGAVRDAHRATALAFWGQVVRQSMAVDRSATGRMDRITPMVVPFVWEQLCFSGPLALWEYAAPITAIAMSSARGMPHDQALALARSPCVPRR